MKRILTGALIMLAAACAPDAERAKPTPPAGPNVAVVSGLMEAFNDHDPDAMRAYWHDDITWVEISGNQSSVVIDNAEALHQELVAYFQTYPEVSSTLENISVNGNYVTAVERPVWEQDGEPISQSSVVVYEIVDERVKRLWYFPPQ